MKFLLALVVVQFFGAMENVSAVDNECPDLEGVFLCDIGPSKGSEQLTDYAFSNQPLSVDIGAHIISLKNIRNEKGRIIAYKSLSNWVKIIRMGEVEKSNKDRSLKFECEAGALKYDYLYDKLFGAPIPDEKSKYKYQLKRGQNLHTYFFIRVEEGINIKYFGPNVESYYNEDLSLRTEKNSLCHRLNVD